MHLRSTCLRPTFSVSGLTALPEPQACFANFDMSASNCAPSRTVSRARAISRPPFQMGYTMNSPSVGVPQLKKHVVLGGIVSNRSLRFRPNFPSARKQSIAASRGVDGENGPDVQEFVVLRPDFSSMDSEAQGNSGKCLRCSTRAFVSRIGYDNNDKLEASVAIAL